nr:uncharacterized protein LOC109156274 [Ipomoea trifida]
MSSPSANAHSPTAADLELRNSKKPKRGRDTMENTRPSSVKEVVQETPLSAGAKTPESAQWGTPVETPNPAWVKATHADPIDTEKRSSNHCSMLGRHGNPSFAFDLHPLPRAGIMPNLTFSFILSLLLDGRDLKLRFLKQFPFLEFAISSFVFMPLHSPNILKSFLHSHLVFT